jgi:hypothetical protein
MAKNNKVIEENEINKDSSITKEQAIKYLVNTTCYKDIAKVSDIYAYPFKADDKVSDGLKGYISIAYGLKIVSGDKNTSFKPDQKLTRAEAMQLIYNMKLNSF